MLLLKISYWIAFASAAICAFMAIGLAEWGLVAPAIGGFIGGSVIAGLDQIVTLLSPEPVLVAEPKQAASTSQKEVSMADLEARLSAAKSAISTSRQDVSGGKI